MFKVGPLDSVLRGIFTAFWFIGEQALAPNLVIRESGCSVE